MSEKNFQQIYRNTQVTLESRQLQNNPLQQFQQYADKSLGHIQQCFDKKQDFRKSEAPQQITDCLAQAASIIKAQNLKIEELKKALETSIQSQQLEKMKCMELSQQKEDQRVNFNQREEQFFRMFTEKQLETDKLQNEIEEFTKKALLDDSIVSKAKYDIIIDMKTLVNIQKEPLKIQYSKNNSLSKEEMKTIMNCSVVGIQGLKNKGKTFVLNELSNDNFPSGFHHSTQGLSVKIDKRDNINVRVYLDSEGINKPARYNWSEDKDFQEYIKKKQEKNNDEDYQNSNESQLQKNCQNRVIEKFQDIKGTEQILQQFLLDQSETIIVVVGMISLEEQKIITIMSELSGKDIIVVHNFKEYTKREYVENEINNNLNVYFPLEIQGIQLKQYKEGTKNSLVYQDQRNEKVYHCILAKKDTPAGDYYNDFTFDFIKYKIELNQTKKDFNISFEFCDFLNKYVRDFVEIGYASEEKRSTKIPQKAKIMKCTDGDECDQISLLEDYEIYTTKDILLDVFGKIRNQINYSIYQEGRIKTVEIELPGDVQLKQATLMKEEEYQVLMLSANKKTDWQEKSGVQEIFNNRNLGLIQHKIIIGRTTDNLNVEKRFTSKNGVYMVQYSITKNDQILEFEKDDDNK